MKAYTITLTPEQARGILVVQARLAKTHPGEIYNRPLRTTKVHDYLRMMLAGLWLTDGMPLRFDINGVLRDGQHRLTALANVKIPGFTLDFSVITGLSPEAQMTMDQGARRSVGDQLALKGIHSGNQVGSYFTAVLNWEEATLRTRPYIEIQQYMDEHPDDLAFIQGRIHQVRKLKVAGAAIGAAIILCARVDTGDASEFLRLLSVNGGPGEGSPINALYAELMKRKGRATAPQYTQESMAQIIKAWNTWRAGGRMSRVVLGAKDKPGAITPL